MHFRNMRMIHQREYLTLGLKAGDNFLRVHPRLDHLQRHLPLHRRTLFGEKYRSEPALTDLLEQFITPDHIALPFPTCLAPQSFCGGSHEAIICKMRGDERLHFFPQQGIAATGFSQIIGTLCQAPDVQGCFHDDFRCKWL